MTRSSRVTAAALVAVLALTLSTLAACAPPQPAERPKPLLSPPTVKSEATLRAGVDLSHPPFAGVDEGRNAGIDIDVASALAGRLGLQAEFVDVKASEIATALASGDADVVLSAPFSADVLSRGTIAGTYLSDGPALFAGSGGNSSAATQSIVASDSARIGTQKGSEAYWRLVAERGSDGVAAYPTLREAFAAMARGEVDYVGADALVGAYIARDEVGVAYVGPLAEAHLLGIAVSADNTKLSDAVRQTLDRLASDGVLDTIRSTWVGGLPKLPLPSSDTSSTPASTSATP